MGAAQSGAAPLFSAFAGDGAPAARLLAAVAGPPEVPRPEGPSLTGSRKLGSIFSWEVIFVAITTLVMAFLYVMVVDFVELVELKAWDLHFKQRGTIEPQGVTAFVTIDEQSVNREGRWPWPRRRMAELLEAVDRHGARVIGLDMGFFEPDLKLRQQAVLDMMDRLKDNPAGSPAVLDLLRAAAQEEDDDAILAQTIKRLSAPLVLGYFFYDSKSSYIPPRPADEVLDKGVCPIVLTREEAGDKRLIEKAGLETNIPVVQDATPFSGSFNVETDPDGAVRWMPLVFRYEGRIFPSLALQMLAVAVPDAPLIVKLDAGGVEDIRLGPVSIPTNNRGELLLNFYGPGYTFPHYSASALLHDEVPANCLENRLVVIGNTTMGLHDLRPTPFDQVFPGVELHCTVMDNVLKEDFLSRSRRSVLLWDFGALAGLAVIFLILQSFLHGALLAGAVAILLAGYIGFTHYAFLVPGIWLNHMYPAMNLVVGYLGTSVHKYLAEEREKNKIRRTLGLYVHGSVMEEMLEHPERLKLGGEKRELSVLFSDIRGFTSLSEKYSPEELVPQLNDYLTRMTQVVFDHHGTLDKYIGDAIMAIFGAPLPQEDHPHRACGTALDMVRTLDVLRSTWAEKGLPVLDIGIGINTGTMMVGNMGSDRRFDYTVIGDNVNLASRLESLTKMYGATILVSDSTWNQVSRDFVGRELDVVRVKGKLHSVTVFEVLGRKDDGMDLRPLDVFHEALELYRRGEWQQALELFIGMEEWLPADRPSRLYQVRCRELLDRPPEGDWSPVTVLDRK